MDCEFIKDLLKLLALHDVTDEVGWSEDLEFYAQCNDAFWWATADAEDITQNSLQCLMGALKDGGDDGMLLYCARQRKMRPQGARYRYINKENWHLFDACGPERATDSGNPKAAG